MPPQAASLQQSMAAVPLCAAWELLLVSWAEQVTQPHRVMHSKTAVEHPSSCKQGVVWPEDCALDRREEGNCTLSPRSDPHQEFGGLNCLIQRRSLSGTAKAAGESPRHHPSIYQACQVVKHSNVP